MTVAEKKAHYATMPKWRGDYLRNQACSLRSSLVRELSELDIAWCKPFSHSDDAEQLNTLLRRLNSIVNLLYSANEFDVFRSE